MPYSKADIFLKQVSLYRKKIGRSYRSSHLPINTTHPIHLMGKVMTESLSKTIFFDVNNNVDLWIEMGYIRVWSLEVD